MKVLKIKIIYYWIGLLILLISFNNKIIILNLIKIKSFHNE